MALIEYLKSTPLPLPEVAERATGELPARTGAVTASFLRGELFLENTSGKLFRLSWSGEEPREERALALPAGKYKLKTYRIVRELEGETWHVSATDSEIREVVVPAEKRIRVEIDDSVLIVGKRRGAGAQLKIEGDAGAGLSVYRGGRRIPIEFRVVDRTGKVLEHGRMRYG